MNYCLIAYCAFLGGAVSLYSFLMGSLEGVAMAHGVGLGLAVLVGYTVGRAIASLLLAIELRLLGTSPQRVSSEAPQLELLPSGGRPLSAYVAVMAMAVCVVCIPFAAMAAIFGGLLSSAGLRELGAPSLIVASSLGGAAALCLTTAVAVTLYYRGRIEWTAFRASVARDTETWRRRGRAVERTLRLRPA